MGANPIDRQVRIGPGTLGRKLEIQHAAQKLADAKRAGNKGDAQFWKSHLAELRRANPSTGAIYDALSVKERLAFGRLGLGKAQIQTGSDLKRARQMVAETQRLKNRLPNPIDVGASSEAQSAMDLSERFRANGTTGYLVLDEPHVRAGEYVLLGDIGDPLFFVPALRTGKNARYVAGDSAWWGGLGVKPAPTGETRQVQEIQFPQKHIYAASSADGGQIYIVGDGQDQSEADLKVFTSDKSGRVDLGECRYIAYWIAKFHEQLAPSARGEMRPWRHNFGEDGGHCPHLFYDRAMRRFILKGGTYHVEGAGIVN